MRKHRWHMQLAHWLLQLKKTKLILVFYLSVVPVVVVAPVFRGFFSEYSGFLFSRKNNFVTTLSLIKTLSEQSK